MTSTPVPFLCPRFVRDVPVVAVIHQVAREVWRYETPWPVAVLGRYLLEPAWLRAYRDVPVVTVCRVRPRIARGIWPPAGNGRADRIERRRNGEDGCWVSGPGSSRRRSVSRPLYSSGG